MQNADTDGLDSDTDSTGVLDPECEEFGTSEEFVHEDGRCVQCLAGYCQSGCTKTFDYWMNLLDEGSCSWEAVVHYRCANSYSRFHLVSDEDYHESYIFDAENVLVSIIEGEDSVFYCDATREYLYVGVTSCDIRCVERVCDDLPLGYDLNTPFCDEMSD